MDIGTSLFDSCFMEGGGVSTVNPCLSVWLLDVDSVEGWDSSLENVPLEGLDGIVEASPCSL